MMTPARLTLMVTACLLAAACGTGEEVTPTPTGSGLTYYQDVGPILMSRCTGCHFDGGIAPMPLTSYEDVGPIADWIADAVTSRRMPPGQTVDGCADYAGDPALTEAQRETIQSWAEGGAAEGAPADLSGFTPVRDPNELSRIDHEVKIPLVYKPVATPDDYRCFIIDWPETEPTFLTGFGAAPGEPRIVHHIIGYLALPQFVEFFQGLDAADPAPGYPCYGGPGGNGQVPSPWLGAWVPNQIGRDLPAGTGIPVAPGSKIILQMHYNTNATTAALTDESSVLLKVDPTVEHPAQLGPVFNRDWAMNGTMDIPARSTATHTYTAIWPTDQDLHEVGIHMHTLGQSAQLSITHADGSETCLVNLDSWNFNWQLAYRLETPIHIAAGETVTVTCTFNNTRDEDVNWGDGTSDEMCIGIIYASDAP